MNGPGFNDKICSRRDKTLKTKPHLGPLLPLEKHTPYPVRHKLMTAANFLLERLLCIHRLDRIYQQIPPDVSPAEFLQHTLDIFRIRCACGENDLAAIPAKGPTIVISNHPFGGMDGILLASLLTSVREDVKIFANYFLGAISELRPLFILVDPFGNSHSAQRNRLAVTEALRWVKNGGMLMAFPAGEVSHFSWKNRKITDPEWSPLPSRLLRLAKASVLPVYFSGRNSNLFHTAGLLHPRLRTVLLPREMHKKTGADIRVKIGKVIHFQKLAAIENDKELTAYLRFRTYLLGNALSESPKFLNVISRNLKKQKPSESIIPPGDPEIIADEIDRLSKRQLLVQSKDLAVYMAYAEQIPNGLKEIGRLREETFRRVGEGTGRSLDLDRFDSSAIHIFAWKPDTQQIAGAYRVAPTDEILKRYGKKGLYTYTLFRYRNELLDTLGPALEMSRSFVRSEYQKNYAPLLLLWKGIGRLVATRPRYKILFGAVSITRDYSAYSRQLMAAFLESHSYLYDLSRFIKPRNPYRQRPLRGYGREKAAIWPEDIEELSYWISGIEADGKGVPILLKQYLKLGGKLLSFNVDPDFGNVLDGLMMVDLSHTDPKLLKRYMGADGFEAFRMHHQGLHKPLPLVLPKPANA